MRADPHLLHATSSYPPSCPSHPGLISGPPGPPLLSTTPSWVSESFTTTGQNYLTISAVQVGATATSIPTHGGSPLT